MPKMSLTLAFISSSVFVLSSVATPSLYVTKDSSIPSSSAIPLNFSRYAVVKPYCAILKYVFAPSLNRVA